MLNDISSITGRGKSITEGSSTTPVRVTPFATGFSTQFKELLLRNARAQWRGESFFGEGIDVIACYC